MDRGVILKYQNIPHKLKVVNHNQEHRSQQESLLNIMPRQQES